MKRADRIFIIVMVAWVAIMFVTLRPRDEYVYFNVSDAESAGFVRISKRTGELCLWHTDRPEWWCGPWTDSDQ